MRAKLRVKQRAKAKAKRRARVYCWICGRPATHPSGHCAKHEKERMKFIEEHYPPYARKLARKILGQ